MRPDRRVPPGLAEALPALESSLADDPTPRNVMRVAEARWLDGDAPSAIGLLEPLVRAERWGIAPRVLLAWCYEDAGRDADAARVRDEAHALDPANPFVAAPVERHLEPEPEPEQEPAPETTVAAPEPETEPTPEPEPDAAALADELLAEPERALTAAELAAVPPGPLYSATLAEIFERQGFEEKAAEIYREVVRLHPEREDLHARLVSLERRLEEIQE